MFVFLVLVHRVCFLKCLIYVIVIVNKKLLKAAGYELADINSFKTLETVAKDITNRSATLGFSAFTSAGVCSTCQEKDGTKFSWDVGGVLEDFAMEACNSAPNMLK